MSTKPEDFAFSAALLLAKEMTENKRLRRELELVYNELNRALGQNAPKAWDRIAEACRVVSGVAVGVVRQSSTRDGNAASRESELVAEVEQLRAALERLAEFGEKRDFNIYASQMADAAREALRAVRG